MSSKRLLQIERMGVPMFQFDTSRFKGKDGLVDPVLVARVWQNPWCATGYEGIYRREAIESAMMEMTKEIPEKVNLTLRASWHERMMNLWVDLASGYGQGWGSACEHANIAAKLYTEMGNRTKASEMYDLNMMYHRCFEASLSRG